jgi:hypothetical protein
VGHHKTRTIDIQIKKRQWGWIGHTLRKPAGAIEKDAVIVTVMYETDSIHSMTAALLCKHRHRRNQVNRICETVTFLIIGGLTMHTVEHFETLFYDFSPGLFRIFYRHL